MIRKLSAVVIMAVLSFSAFAQSKMVKIPSGSFNMGSPASERQRNVDEKQHQVTVSSFYADAYEVTQKDLNAEARPPLKTKIADMTKYDVVLLGYPTWWATLPMPVMTFLESYDFSGKTIISFSSHGGTRYGDSVSDLGKKVQSSYLGLPFEFYYGGGRDLESRIEAWFKNSGL